MKNALFAALVCASSPALAALPPTVDLGARSFHFASTNGSVVEYLPPGQDLYHYSELLTVLPHSSDFYFQTRDLKEFTDRNVAVIKRRGGQVLGIECDASGTECLVKTLYVRDKHVEFGVARHAVVDGDIRVAMFAHREYGWGAKRRAQAWSKTAAAQDLIAGLKQWSIPKAEKKIADEPRVGPAPSQLMVELFEGDKLLSSLPLWVGGPSTNPAPATLKEGPQAVDIEIPDHIGTNNPVLRSVELSASHREEQVGLMARFETYEIVQVNASNASIQLPRIHSFNLCQQVNLAAGQSRRYPVRSGGGLVTTPYSIQVTAK